MKSHFMEMLLLNRCFILFYFIIILCVFKQMCFQAFYQKDMTVLSFCKQTLHLPWFCRLRASAGEGAGGRQHLPPSTFLKKKIKKYPFSMKRNL